MKESEKDVGKRDSVKERKKEKWESLTVKLYMSQKIFSVNI